MKRKSILLIAIIIMLVIIKILPVTAVSNMVQAYLVNYKINYYSTLNERLVYPLISYNDNTYMAVRDVASLWNKSIDWNEGNQTINFKSNDAKKNIIKEPETALEIGKAIFKEYYEDKVNKDSAYYVAYSEPDACEADDLWNVYVIFNPTEEVNSDELYVMLHCDARVDINPLTCNFRLLNTQADGKFETIVKFKTWN